MSSNDMPELGSKISLISKADIRYEGKLYTVDPQDCTIALANVRSFGTEDRKTSHPVPAQNQVYDYILFRATDIKDISVVPPTQLLCDPAIVQLSSSINNRYGNSSSNTNQDYPQMLSGLYQTSSGSTGGGSGGGFNPMQSGLHPLARVQAPPQAQKSVLDFLTASRSSTPSLKKPSPTSVDQSTQANARQKERQLIGNRNQSQDHRGGGGMGNPGDRGRMMNSHPGNQQRNRSYQQPQNPNHLNRGWQNLNHHQMQGGNRQMQQQHQQQRNNRPRQMNNGRQFTRAPGPRPKPQPTQPLKFESDYDFDKANSEFEELKSEISKLKLTDAGEVPVQLMNGDAEKKEETSIEGGSASMTENEEDQYFYNKTKSFFDNISCEAIERSKGRSQRTDWRKERMLNSETFGVATARRGPQYHRGRGGGYYFNNRGGGYFQRGYRHQQGGGQRFRTGKSPAQRQPQAQVASA